MAATTVSGMGAARVAGARAVGGRQQGLGLMNNSHRNSGAIHHHTPRQQRTSVSLLVTAAARGSGLRSQGIRSRSAAGSQRGSILVTRAAAEEEAAEYSLEELSSTRRGGAS